LFESLNKEELEGYNILVVGGDGRYWNRETIYEIIRIGCANGVDEIHVAH